MLRQAVLADAMASHLKLKIGRPILKTCGDLNPSGFLPRGKQKHISHRNNIKTMSPLWGQTTEVPVIWSDSESMPCPQGREGGHTDYFLHKSSTKAHIYYIRACAGKWAFINDLPNVLFFILISFILVSVSAIARSFFRNLWLVSAAFECFLRGRI